MKTIEEIRARLDDIFEDVGDCMTMPCSAIETMCNEALLEDIRILRRVDDADLIQEIETEAEMQKANGYCSGLDYVALLSWINK